jgi:multidrug efflux pump subunit AcrA (membrane-fusion protein)
MLISEGARADVILDALPGQVVDGTVSSIGSAAQNQQGVVSYPIRVRLQLPNAAGFLEGLSATASIVIHEERDVLLLPVQAIYGTFEQPIVRVMNNGSIEERVVVLGNSDDFWTVVREGVVEGDRVVLDVVQASTDPFAQFRQLRQAGGGAGFPVRVPFPQGGGTRP